MSWIAAAAAEPFKYELKILFTALLTTLAGLTKGGTRRDDDVTACHDANKNELTELSVFGYDSTLPVVLNKGMATEPSLRKK
jgi:hypothetical protein